MAKPSPLSPPPWVVRIMAGLLSPKDMLSPGITTGKKDADHADDYRRLDVRALAKIGDAASRLFTDGSGLATVLTSQSFFSFT
jgi:hypothetical protein